MPTTILTITQVRQMPEFTSCLKSKTGVRPTESFMGRVVRELIDRESGAFEPIAISKHEFDRLLWKL